MQRTRRLIPSLIFLFLLALPTPIAAAISFQEIIIDSASDGTPRTSWGKGTGDLDGDGDPDLIVGANAGGGLVWYENPSWQKRQIADGAFSVDIETVDLDRDGDLDIVTNVGQYTKWYKNNGKNGTWTQAIIASREMHDVEMADINGDGKLDAVTRNQTEWRGNGNILYVQIQGSNYSFSEQSRSDLPHGEGLLVRDMDRDGDSDIIWNTLWLENNGGNVNTWPKHPYVSSWHSNTYIDACDFNNDGNLDIVLTPSELLNQYYRVSYFLSPQNPKSTGWTEVVVDPSAEAVLHYVGCADFDQDGDIDISTAEMSQGTDPDEVRIYENAGNNTVFTKRVINTRGSHSMRMVDIDSDGDIDLFGSNQPGVLPVILLINNNTITATTPSPIRSPTPSPTTGSKPGDANGDNLVDGRDYIIWLLHYGQNVTGVTNGDFDGNNIVDGRDYVLWLNNYGR